MEYFLFILLPVIIIVVIAVIIESKPKGNQAPEPHHDIDDHLNRRLTDNLQSKLEEMNDNRFSVPQDTLSQSSNTSSPQKAYAYVTAANGMVARIPVDRLDEWQKGQEKLKSGERSPDSEKLKEELMDRLRRARQSSLERKSAQDKSPGNPLYTDDDTDDLLQSGYLPEDIETIRESRRILRERRHEEEQRRALQDSYMALFSNFHNRILQLVSDLRFYKNLDIALPAWIIVISRIILISEEKLQSGSDLNDILLSAIKQYQGENQRDTFPLYTAYFESFLLDKSKKPRCEYSFGDTSLIEDGNILNILIAALCDAVVNPGLATEGADVPVVLYGFTDLLDFTLAFLPGISDMLSNYIPDLLSI